MQTADSAGLSLVTTEDPNWGVAVADLPTRSRAIVERLLRITGPQPSEREAQDVLGIDRGTWRKIRGGDEVMPHTYKKAERNLDDRELELSIDTTTAPAPEVFEFTMTIGALDVQVSAKGRPEDADLVREQVTKAVNDMMRTTRGD